MEASVSQFPASPSQLRFDGLPVADVKSVVAGFQLPLLDLPAPMYDERAYRIIVRKVKESDAGNPGTEGRPIARTEGYVVVGCEEV